LIVLKKQDLPNIVYTKGLKGFSGIVGLDILFLTFIFGSSMNLARSLAPALLSGV
jgi:aquaporin Z